MKLYGIFGTQNGSGIGFYSSTWLSHLNYHLTSILHVYPFFLPWTLYTRHSACTNPTTSSGSLTQQLLEHFTINGVVGPLIVNLNYHAYSTTLRPENCSHIRSTTYENFCAECWLYMPLWHLWFLSPPSEFDWYKKYVYRNLRKLSLSKVHTWEMKNAFMCFCLQITIFCTLRLFSQPPSLS